MNTETDFAAEIWNLAVMIVTEQSRLVIEQLNEEGSENE
jgi:hypothetical protein